MRRSPPAACARRSLLHRKANLPRPNAVSDRFDRLQRGRGRRRCRRGPSALGSTRKFRKDRRTPCEGARSPRTPFISKGKKARCPCRMIRTNRAIFSNWNEEAPQSSDQRQHLRSTTARRAAFQSEPGLKLASGRRGRLKPGDRGPRLGAGARSAISWRYPATKTPRASGRFHCTSTDGPIPAPARSAFPLSAQAAERSSPGRNRSSPPEEPPPEPLPALPRALLLA